MKTFSEKIAAAIIAAVSFCSCFKDPIIIPQPEPPNLQMDSLSILPSVIPAADYTDMTFTDLNTGYAVSVSGDAIRTSDGGLHWQALTLPLQAYLHRIQFVSAGTGYIIGGADTIPSGFILRTTDAGQTWQRFSLNTPLPGYPAGFHFIDDTTGFVAGKNYFRKTIDGGRTWTEVPGITSEEFTDVKFRDNRMGYLTAKSGRFYRTLNGGNSWQAGQLNISVPLGEIVLAPTKSYVRVGNNTLTDLETGSTGCVLPSKVTRVLFLSTARSVGVGQYYESGFWPYGDISLTSDLWQTSNFRKYEPGQAVNFRALAKIGEHSVLMLGHGLLQTTVVRLNY